MKLSEHPDWENNKLNIIRDIINDLQIPYIVIHDDRYKEFIFRSTNECNFIVNISEDNIGKCDETILEHLIENRMKEMYTNFKIED